MAKQNDAELIAQLAQRLEEKEKALYSLRAATLKLEKVNRRLLESERLKGHFLSNIRNEINNPLAAIEALAREVAGGAIADPVQVRAVAATIVEESFSLDFQLRNIFAAAELEAGEADVSPANVDAERLIADTVGGFRVLADARGIALQTTWQPGGRGTFRTDAGKLQLVVANLVSNALKFSPDGGVVTVRGSCGGGELEVSVRDLGIGISADDQTRLFERFHQLESGRAKSFAGHGLGLCVARALVELLGGRVGVESAAGAGSTFTVRLPEAAGEPTATYADAGNEFFFGGERF